MIKAENDKSVTGPLVIKSERGYGPTSDELPCGKSLLGTFKVSRRKIINQIENPLAKTAGGFRVPFCDVLDGGLKVQNGLGGVDDFQRLSSA